jgi:adenylate cyclase, class 2
MSYEVELKYRLVDHDQLASRLRERGAARGATITQEDVYYNHPARDFALTNEAFRIRRVVSEKPALGSADPNESGFQRERNLLTYKGPRRAGPTKTRQEIEIALAPGTTALEGFAELLKNLGFRKIAMVRKSRTAFHLTEQGHQIEVALDAIAGLGRFAEIETQAATEADLPAAQSAVLGLASALGLTEVEPRSYLRMVLEVR